MTKAKTGAEDIRWDLSFMYEGTDDERLERDIAEVERLAEAFGKAFKGQLDTKLGDAIRAYAELDTLADKVLVYLSLRQSLDLGDAEVNAKIHEAQSRLSHASGTHLTFFDIEVGSLSQEAIDTQAEGNPDVRHHLPFIGKIRRFAQHLLDESVESALAKRSLFGASSWADFYDEVESDLRFDFEGETRTLTEMLHLMSEHEDAGLRARALKEVNAGFKGPFVKFSAQTINMVVGAKRVEDRERGYGHSMALRNKSNQIPDEVVTALHDAVRDVGAPLARRYYRLKAKHLGLERLRWSDRNAKMPFADKEIVPWETAKATVLEAYADFSDTLAEIIGRMFDEQRIDAPAVPGKRSGAFNLSVSLPERGPVSFTFLNYKGSNRDVMTLAHELGHGVHGILAGEAQGPLQQATPIAFAETASVFGEMTTFDHLLRKLEKDGAEEARLSLIMGKIDDIMNTVVRQVGFSNFERRIHESDKKLSHAEIDRIWSETTRELYGEEGDVFTYEDTEHLWCYVSHFHRPYYVYGYAFGEMLTQSLYGRRAEYGDRFESLYLELLRAAGTKDAAGLLEPFGLDPRREDFFVAGLEGSLGRLIEEAERITSKRFGL